MLEVFNLRQNLDTTRKELAHALYQHDAACHVIARLLKEKGELQRKFEENEIRVSDLIDRLKNQSTHQHQEKPEESKAAVKSSTMESNAIEAGLRERMEQLSDSLIEQRKQMKAPEDYPKKEDLSSYKETETFQMHENGGILSMDVYGDDYVLTGGKNGEAAMFDVQNQAIVSKFVPYYGNEIGFVKFAPFLSNDEVTQQPTRAVIAAQKQAFAGLWDLSTQRYLYNINCHDGVVSDVSFQPLNDYMVSASSDSTWSFHNVQKGVSLAKFQEDAAVSQIEFHPDGLVLAVGLKTGAIKVYDIRDQKVAMELQGPSASEVKKIAFSNKGTYLAASWKDHDVCRIYSLHKQCQFTDIANGGIAVNDIAFDQYGGYLLTAAAN